MTPNIPVSVWEQIAVVIVFAFLLGGLGWVLVRLFTQAVADINAHYAALIKDSNLQWQKYFDARAETCMQGNRQILGRVDDVAGTLEALALRMESLEPAPVSSTKKSRRER